MGARAEALRQASVMIARQYFPAFMQYAFYDYDNRRSFEQQWFHDDWSAAMDRYKRLLIVAPRNHGKTTQIVGRTIWELGKDTNLRIKIVCAADGRAKERLLEVVQNLTYNPRVREVFPLLERDNDAPWNAHKIYVRRTALHKDASVEAVGITSTATGGRADILIPDDVVDRRNALSMPALRGQINQAWKSDWTQLLDKNSRVWGICTLWHKDDLNHQLMANQIYKTLFYAIDDDFGSMWIERFPEDVLRERFLDIGSVEFNRGFRNKPVDVDTQMVPPSFFRYSDLSKDPEFKSRVHLMHFFQSYDTAGAPTGAADQDYSASVIIAVDEEAHRVYVIDAWHARLTLKKMAAEVHREAERYHPFKIVIEKVGQSSLHEWVCNDYPKLTPLVETATPKIKKALRLLAVTPLMESGTVIFSKRLDPNLPDWQPGRGSLVHELEDFPFAKHDDMVDAFSQALYWARRYFLDEWSAGADGGEIQISVGSTDGEQTPYLY
jgi:predicted phage terminase large subunit-like protein